MKQKKLNLLFFCIIFNGLILFLYNQKQYYYSIITMSYFYENDECIHVTLHEYYCNGKCGISTSIFSPKYCYRLIIHKNKMTDGLPLKDILIKYFKDHLPHFPTISIQIESILYTSITKYNRIYCNYIFST